MKIVKNHYSVEFYSIYKDGDVDNDYNVYDNKALYEFLLNAGIVDADEAYEIEKKIFADEVEEFEESFDDYEHFYNNSEIADKIVKVTEEMVEVLQKNLEKYDLEDKNFFHPECEFVALICHYTTRK